MKTAITENFIRARDKLFRHNRRQKDSLKFSVKYSLLVEEYIRRIAGNKTFNFAFASAGSFSRRELSPYSDIDIIIISDSVDENRKEISELLTSLWDNGIEASHVARDFSDIQKYLETDLHSFTQFFETRFILGSYAVYEKWNELLFAAITENDQKRLLFELTTDRAQRYEKYGDSPKVLEPNVKNSAGGLRDFQLIEWMYIIRHKTLLNKQNEVSQAEAFLEILLNGNYTTPAETLRVLNSYRLVMAVRNLLHLVSNQKNDRFEFTLQPQISTLFTKRKMASASFMKEYFEAANIINRFSKSVVKRFQDEISNPIPDSLTIVIDEDFSIKGKTISMVNSSELSFPDILRGFYYRGKYTAHFDEHLRSKIVEVVESFTSPQNELESSVFFREILKLEKNVGQTLAVMNELGVLGTFMPEFGDLVGFFQTGVYHSYTADEHTLMTIQNLEKLDRDVSDMGKIYNGLKNKEILYLALLFHDIGKPIDISGHEIIGAEMASSVMDRLGYSDDEIDMVSFLVRNHLLMEQVAFRRNLNDPDTLNSFSNKFSSVNELDLLYLVTYADLSAVNSAVWTSWKSDLLSELYRKAKSMIQDQITGEELLISNTLNISRDVLRHSDEISEDHVQEHIDSINDITYAHIFSDEEIARHVEEIRRGITLSVSFKETSDFTNMTIITKDTPGLLSKICGVLSINDANIHDAKIFTRKDGIVIDTFNVTDFRSHNKLNPDKYTEIEKNLSDVLQGIIQLSNEFAGMKSRWWRIENKLFKRSGKIKIEFEKHKKYTIIDVFSPDRLGFLYQVTNKMNELGLVIYFAKIATKGDDIVDSFYVLNRNGKKISPNDYEFIKTELTETITGIL